MSPTILVIDDSADDQILYQRAFRNGDRDFRLEMAASSDAGYAYLADAGRPDLILLDYNLPDMDGLGFMQRLPQYADTPIPIVMLTGESSAAVAVEAMKYGAADYLVKDTAGIYLRLLPTVVDRAMTASAQRAQTLRLQQETEALLRRNRALMKSARDGIHVMDVDGNLVEANDAFYRLLGYAPEEAPRLNVADWNAQWTAEELREKFRSMVGKSAVFETRHRRRDGTLIDVEISTSGVEIDGQLLFFATSRDITERKQAEAILRLHKQVIDTSIDGFWVTDLQGKLLEANEAYARISGYPLEELMHMHISQLEAKEQGAEVRAHIARVIAQGHDRFETRHRRKDGHEIDIEISVTYMAEAQRMVVFCRDIGERKRAERAQQRNEANLRALLDNSPYLTWLKDAEGRYITINKAFADYLGLDDVAQAAGRTDLDLQPKALAEKYRADDAEVMAQRRQKHVEESAFDGKTTHWVETWKTPIIDVLGNVLGTAGFARDITERKEAELAMLRESESEHRRAEKLAQQFGQVLQSSFNEIYLFDAGTLRFLETSAGAEDNLGYSAEEMEGLTPLDIDPAHTRESFGALLAPLRDGDRQFLLYETEHRRKDGTAYPAEVRMQFMGGPQPMFLAIVQDIAGRKRAEAELHRLNRAQRLLSDCNAALVHAAEEGPLLESICRLVVATGGYHMAWIGMAEQDAQQTVRPVAQSGFEEGYLEGANISWGDTERGRGPIGIAIRTGMAQVNQDFLSNPLLSLWREAALARGYRSSIALPLMAEGRAFAVLTIYSSVADSFHSEEQALLEELADNLAYGVSALRLRVAHDRATEALRRSAQEIEGLYNLAPCGYHSLDADGIVRSINDTELSWLGYAREEVVGKMRFTDLISPARIPEFHETFSQLKRRGYVRDIENLQRRKDGSLFPVLINATAMYDADGNYLTSRSTVVDISRRKQAEERLRENDIRLRALVGNLPGTVFEMTRDGAGNVSLPYVSEGAASLFGVTAGELMGRPELLRGCVDAEDAPGFDAGLARSARTLAAWDWEGRINTAAQRGKWLSLRATPRRLDDGTVVWGGVILNITQCKRAEIELVKSQKLLRELVVQGERVRDDERKRIARELHDELGQLLTALRTNVALMRIRLGDGDAELQNIVGRVNGLLEQSIRCTRHVVTNLRPAALDMGIVPAIRWLCDEFSTHSGTPCVLQADEAEVSLDEALEMTVFRVVQEALTNASRYAEAGRVEVSIVQQDGSLSVTVTDDGKGFDSLDRAKPTSFGLLGMRERAIALGAMLSIDSAPGQGTRISFVVPDPGTKGDKP
jgi:PAS domain S-box-containing protein